MDRTEAVELLRRLHEAQQTFYSGGDEAPVRALLADDIHWHVPGRSAIAVMVERTAPLTVSPEAEKVSIQAYATSWARGLGLLQE